MHQFKYLPLLFLCSCTALQREVTADTLEEIAPVLEEGATIIGTATGSPVAGVTLAGMVALGLAAVVKKLRARQEVQRSRKRLVIDRRTLRRNEDNARSG